MELDTAYRSTWIIRVVVLHDVCYPILLSARHRGGAKKKEKKKGGGAHKNRTEWDMMPRVSLHGIVLPEH